MKEINLLYVHGMGGGGESRIPSILNERINGYIEKDKGVSINVIVRTYDFDPGKASGQIGMWTDEIKPSLILGESLGSIHAIALKGYPHVLVSPSLNAPLYFTYLSWLALIPGVTFLLDKIYKPKPGDRQSLHFRYGTIKKWKHYRDIALSNSPYEGSKDRFHAFFGTKDRYRISGIVSIRTYRKYFGKTYTMYSGTHCMEEEFVLSLLIPEILHMLDLG
ncbi:MAG: hypothetical protein LKI59_08300 [Bacteroidales bacterium]|jgi:hypothetical protein|nr:hypothetical protein [Bacteroidales bacterium]